MRRSGNFTAVEPRGQLHQRGVAVTPHGGDNFRNRGFDGAVVLGIARQQLRQFALKITVGAVEYRQHRVYGFCPIASATSILPPSARNG